MDKLVELISQCKYGVYITVNTHRDAYQTAGQRLSELDLLGRLSDLDTKTMNKMIETNTVVELQFYRRTPISSYVIFHHDINEALNEALAILEDNKTN